MALAGLCVIRKIILYVNSKQIYGCSHTMDIRDIGIGVLANKKYVCIKSVCSDFIELGPRGEERFFDTNCGNRANWF